MAKNVSISFKKRGKEYILIRKKSYCPPEAKGQDSFLVKYVGNTVMLNMKKKVSCPKELAGKRVIVKLEVLNDKENNTL